jgi:hypothetical protein
LTKEDGTKVEFVGTVPSNQIIVLNQMKGTPLEEIHVVQKYPNVFLEDLPSTPPYRDMDFVIELLPRTPPISKRPYRMPIRTQETNS